jgi:hypothetical protein
LLKIIFFSLLILSIIPGVGYNLRCPKCKKWWSKKNAGSKMIKSETKNETVIRNDIHKDRNGKEIGRTQRKENILVEYSYYDKYHFCKKCGHEWTTYSSTRKEV